MFSAQTRETLSSLARASLCIFSTVHLVLHFALQTSTSLLLSSLFAKHETSLLLSSLFANHETSPFCFANLHAMNHHLHATNLRCHCTMNRRYRRTMSLRCRHTMNLCCHRTTNHFDCILKDHESPRRRRHRRTSIDIAVIVQWSMVFVP